MSKIQVRTAKIEDFTFIVASQLAMAWETEGLRLEPETLKKGVHAVFDDPGKGEYVIAEIEGQPVGMLLTLPEWSDWRNGKVLWVHSVYTLPEFRGQGIYRALYAEIQSRVKSGGEARGIRLYVEKSNHKAQKTYQKLGMSNDHYDLYEWLP